MTKIPKILHQISRHCDDELKRSRDSFLSHHPDWTHRHWNDADCENLVRERCPGFLETWTGFDLPIKKWDSIRSIILYEFGGVYVDVDVLFYQPLQHHLREDATLLFREPVRDHNKEWRSTSIRSDEELDLTEFSLRHVKNHFMGSSAHHPLWQLHIEYMQRSSDRDPRMDILVHTGGDSLATVINEGIATGKIRPAEIQLLKHNYFINADFAFETSPDDFDPEAVCARHFCSGSWVETEPLPSLPRRLVSKLRSLVTSK